MSRSMKRIVLWILVPLILVLILLIALHVFASRIVNLESIKNSIEAAISKELDGRFSYERVGLSIFPRPRVVLQGLTLSIPESLSGSMKTLDLYPELWPLITGKLRFTKVRLDRPDVHFSLLGKTGDPSGLETPPESSPERTLAAVLGFVASRMPTLTIAIEQGKLTFNRGEHRLFSLQEVESRIVFLPAEYGSQGSSVVSSEGHFQMIGGVQGIITESEHLPGPIHIAVKRLEVLPRTISLLDTRIQILDTSLSVSGRLDDYLTPTQKANLTLDGTVGSDTVQWIRTVASLPPELTIHAPVTLSQARLFWNRSGMTRLEGKASVEDDLSLLFDVSWGLDQWVVKDLSIRDRESKATLAWSFENKVLNLSFIGNLSQSTLNRLFEHERFRFGWIRGDFRAKIVLDRPRESTARGTLEGEQLVFPYQLKIPITLDRFSLRATDQTVTLDPVVLTLGTNRHTVRGKITASADGWLMDLASDGLEWETLQALFPPDAEGNESATQGQRHVSVQTTIRLSTDYLTAGRWRAAPVRADISLGSDGLRISLKKAVVCGINLPGKVTVTPAEIHLDLRPIANSQELESTLTCLTGEDRRITGTFDLTGSLTTRGTVQTLLDALQGTIAFTAKDGRMFQDSVVVRILTYLNVTDLLRGNYPDPGRDGVPYTSLVVRGTLKKGTLSLDEAVLISPLVNLAGGGSINLSDKTLDLTVLAAPFTTTDTIVKRIPLIKDIVAGSVITIPIRVAGSFQNPEVKAIPPGAVAKGAADLMKRTLGIPFKMIEPIIPGGKGPP